MKTEINPIVLVSIIVVVVALIAVFGYRALQPAPYTPSPGVSSASGAVPGSVQQSAPTAASAAPTTPTSSYYPAAPPGSIPGKPVGNGQ